MYIVPLARYSINEIVAYQEAKALRNALIDLYGSCDFRSMMRARIDDILTYEEFLLINYYFKGEFS